MNIEDLGENPDVPKLVAEGFVKMVSDHGYSLDYSLDSLFEVVENIFEDKRYSRGGSTFNVNVEGIEQTHNFENGLTSYLGETLVRLYGGQWKGFFSAGTGANFYTSYTQFGEFVFKPFAYVGYRLGNGVEDTGNLKKLMSRISKSLQDGVNYKKQELQEIIDSGHIAFDNEPWS